ncbi:MAG: hypothetical protein U9N61_11060 [Euryarchaeota archaeon]|nr:hypothetical protein [Euryarchaeota archaeon]
MSNLNQISAHVTTQDRIAAKRRDVHNPKIQHKLAKNRVTTLYLNGLDVYDIRRETGFELSYCNKLIKAVKKEIKNVDKAQLFRQIRAKLVQIVDNHGMISAELIKVFLTAVDAGDEATLLRVGREITRNNLSLGKLLNQFGMGVAVPAGSSDILTPSDSSNITDLVEVGVSDVPRDVEGLRRELKESMGRLTNYLEVTESRDDSKGTAEKKETDI